MAEVHHHQNAFTHHQEHHDAVAEALYKGAGIDHSRKDVIRNGKYYNIISPKTRENKRKTKKRRYCHIYLSINDFAYQ